MITSEYKTKKQGNTKDWNLHHVDSLFIIIYHISMVHNTMKFNI